jgi:hypothetical protein
MLQSEEYIRMSLDLDLFFLRIMKEHSFFLKAAFTAKNVGMSETAGYFMHQFEGLLHEAVGLAGGVVKDDIIKSGQFYTQYTLDAEKVSQYYTGILIDSSITGQEQSIQPQTAAVEDQSLEGMVYNLNQKAMASVTALASFKSKLLSDVLSCRLFTNTYPLLIDHILREAVFFNSLLLKLQNRIDIRTEKDLLDQEVFWNRIMAEHAKFIRGLLDPTEETLFDAANLFGKQFDELTAESKQAMSNPALLPKATGDSLNAAIKIRDFKAAGTSGILNCKVKSMILPLLGDHVLREANHFIYILQKRES